MTLRFMTSTVLLVGVLALAPSMAMADDNDEKADEEKPKRVRVFIPKDGKKPGSEVTIDLDGTDVKTLIKGRIRMVGPDGKVQELDLEDLMQGGGDAAAPFLKLFGVGKDGGQGIGVFFDEDMENLDVKGLEELLKGDADPDKVREWLQKHMRGAKRERHFGGGDACPHCGRGGEAAGGPMGMFGDDTPPQLRELLRGLMGGRGGRGMGAGGMGPFGSGRFGPGRMHTEHQVRTFINDGSGWREVPQGGRGMAGPLGRERMHSFGIGGPAVGGRGGMPGMGGRGPMTAEHALEMAEQMQKRAEEMRKHAEELRRQAEERRKAAEVNRNEMPPEIRKALEGGGMSGGAPSREQLEQQIKMLKEMLERLRKAEQDNAK